MGGGCTTPPPTTMSHYKQAKRKRNDEKYLEIERGRLRNNYHSLWGSLSVVWMPLGSQNPSQPDLNLQKPAMLAENVHTTIPMKKNFCFFRTKIFLEIFYEKIIL
jgi:hypothetical protein